MSYSEIVDAIQGDKAKAKELIIEFVKNYEHFESEAERLQYEMSIAKVNKNDAFESIHKVLEHLKMNTPVQLNIEDRIITIEDNLIVSVFNIL